jgi:hypothetical protein
LKLGTFVLKKIVEVFFSKLQNGGLNQESSNCFFSFGFHTFWLSTYFELVVTSTMASQLAQKIGLHFKIG